jgi:hypothetical protein
MMICLNMHGTRAVQKLCESVTQNGQIEAIVAGLLKNTINLVKV